MTSIDKPRQNDVQCVRSRQDLAEIVDMWRRDGYKIGVVPTMGALHNGHLSLITLIQNHCDKVITSIFVNPTQFGPNEDLERYPRDEASDVAKLTAGGCDLIYVPRVSEMYPEGSVTDVRVEQLSDVLEGLFRPHFFYGVTTVVARLFIHTRPDVAIFGEKDYQQLQIIRRMTLDLGFPIQIIGAPTVRDSLGLALSSRNAYLSDEELDTAREINRTLVTIKDGVEAGSDINDLLQSAKAHLKSRGFDPIDYIALVDAQSLQTIAGVLDAPTNASSEATSINNQTDDNAENVLAGEGRLLVAAWLGKTRLIDNLDCAFHE